MKGDCFSSLNANEIKKLCIYACTIEEKINLYNLLANLKNLNSFEIHENFDLKEHIDAYEIVRALLKSKCENIHEFIMDIEASNGDPLFQNVVSEFLQKQKYLRILKMERVIVTQAFMNNLSSNHAANLEYLNVRFYEIYENIYRFKNLKTFESLNLIRLTDGSLRSLSACPNLECINIYVNNNHLTSFGEACFSRFNKLKIFRFSTALLCIDNILKALIQCKNLREIWVSGNHISEAGLNHLSLVPNLEVLDISGIYFYEKQVCNLIQQALNLKELYINDCDRTLKFFIDISEIKTNRGDKNILRIHYLESRHKKFLDNVNGMYGLNFLPLISLCE